MKKLIVLFPLFATVLVAGCSITARIPPPVEIKVDGGGGHCPPGQAKKGRC